MDSDKLKMLENNVNMMTAELNKICRLFKIKELNRDDLSQYPEGKNSEYIFFCNFFDIFFFDQYTGLVVRR